MKVAMENAILIVCPQGFAPLTSKRHTSPMRWVLMSFIVCFLASARPVLKSLLIYLMR